MTDSPLVLSYRTAEQLLRHNRPQLVFGDTVRPTWLTGDHRFRYSKQDRDGVHHFLVDPRTGTREPASEPAPAPGRRPPGPLEVPSPDGKWLVFRRGHDLWLRSAAGTEEFALTTDGAADHEYAGPPSAFTPLVMLRAVDLPELPPSVVWSPDSTKLITHRTDERDVPAVHLVESAPPGGGRPALITMRDSMPGDSATPRGELTIIDIGTRTVVRAQAEPLRMSYVSPILTGRVWWERDGSAVYYLESAPDLRTLRLNRIDPGTGEVRTLIEEHGDTRVEPTQWMMRRPTVRVFDSGRSTLWYSQRDGWGHLYHYRTDTTPATHAAPVQVTAGRYVVEQILRVDENERLVYFLAAGLIAADPYRRQMCRIALDGTGFTRVSDDDLDHEVSVPGHEEYFVDSASATDTPPVITVRDWDGKLLVELERADVSLLRELGWRPPERFRATAADGSTDIYGLLYLPHDFDPRRRYPVIDHLYPGPHTTRVSPGFAQGMSGPEAEALAALGFAVVAIDGHGTPGRDKAFHDASYGHLGDAGGLDDHIAAIRELARTRPWLDLDRVGATGHSGGGYATVRALCAHPDFYTVGVAESGDHDPRIYHQFFGESYDGPYDDETYRQSGESRYRGPATRQTAAYARRARPQCHPAAHTAPGGSPHRR